MSCESTPGMSELPEYGLTRLTRIHWNLDVARLCEEAIRRGEARLSPGGALLCDTGAYTGRSPNDKFVVRGGDGSAADDIWWGKVNQPMEPDVFEALLGRVQAYLQGHEVFVQDLYAGADERFRIPVRVITQHAWHNLFARNMFISSTVSGKPVDSHDPRFTVIQAPDFHAIPERDGTHSVAFIVANVRLGLVIIGGTPYAGEIKKSIFSLLNFEYPTSGVLPMHASANIGPDGQTAVFFGLSGTGKTTLSADKSRQLIGDDEHGWSDRGIFNFEGGCYAKVIRLSPTGEPEIYATTRRFGTILENVIFDETTHELDLDDDAKTENTRASYPLEFIPNIAASGQGGQPSDIVFLTCDAFGVLPPISRLSPEQAMYHFLSGYTAKVAGTERGVTEPKATFSAGFGEPFLMRRPIEYAKMLREKIEEHGTRVWLLNTGWSGGAYGEGERMALDHTRALLNAAIGGDLDGVPVRKDPNFGVDVPTSCPGVPDEILDPRETWAEPAAYDAKAKELAGLFTDNFDRFKEDLDGAVLATLMASGPQVSVAGSAN